MSAQSTEKSAELLPVKIASELVPYSRDYITRLARDGRVTAVQIDRQWFINRTSLLNFHIHSEIEDSVRSRRLSLVRKNEIEARAARNTRLEILTKKLSGPRHQTLVQTVLILVCGIGTGVLMLSVLRAVDQNPNSVVASALQSDWPTSPLARVAQSPDPSWLEKTSVSESTEKMPIGGGIVLVPASATNTDVAADFFSDDVTVEMTGPTTGVIRNNETEMSFVRVPNTAEANVLPTAVSNTDAL